VHALATDGRSLEQPPLGILQLRVDASPDEVIAALVDLGLLRSSRNVHARRTLDDAAWLVEHPDGDDRLPILMLVAEGGSPDG
jgi:hypothetical protein